MDAKDIIHYKFLYLLSRNLVPSRSKSKKYDKSEELKNIYINPYPKKLKK
jgi:hypothetical protein